MPPIPPTGFQRALKAAEEDMSVVTEAGKRQSSSIVARHLDIITRHYGDNVAEHSKAPLINHINEGLVILKWLNATDEAKSAYCIHPLFQSDDDLVQVVRNETCKSHSPYILLLAMEYRNKANAWLSNVEMNDEFVPPTLPIYDVKIMLIADKIQNYKDFMKYHYGIHPRSDELDKYFHAWIEYLGADRYLNFCLDLIE